MYSKVLDVIISTIMRLKSTTLVCTVLNEQDSIERFIDSIAVQSVKPNEIIIVDGGSTDLTVSLIRSKIIEHKNKLNIRLLVKKGNRSVGRNFGIKNSMYEIVLLTDSGCLLDLNWVKNIIKPFEDKSTDVVAGYYKGKPANLFQKCLIPFVLVMEDKLNPKEFLPATRSMAILKKVWKKVGKFNEKLSHNEDYAFSNKLKEKNFNIVFEKSAVVYWLPRSSFKQAFKMFSRFAYGDIEAGILRPSVLLTFFRYFMGIYLLILIPIMKSLFLDLVIITLVFLYISWSIYKNYKFIKNLRALFYLPLLQFTADLAVILGSLAAFIKTYNDKHMKYLKENKVLIILIFFYITIMLSMINYGIPNLSHPFNYFMDEWHQNQSVRNLFKFGSPNIAGSANGSVFQFFLSGIYLIPFIVLGIVNPFVIKSSVSQLDIQHTLFQILRFNTIIFGVLSIVVFYYICKKYFKLNAVLATFVFIFNPVWIMLSNYFKYDIALMFWTLMSFLFFLRYSVKPNLTDFLMAAIFSALALSVKLSPFALLPFLVIIFFIFTPNPRQRIKWLLSGLVLYFVTFLAYGIPDILLGKGSLYEYLSSTLLRTPNYNAANVVLHENIWQYLSVNLYPSLFGHALYYVSALYILAAVIYVFIKFLDVKKIIQLILLKKELFIFFVLFILFGLSLYPLKLDATNNRALIILPFLSVFFALGLKLIISKLNKNYIKYFTYAVIIILLSIQLLETFSWVYLKLSPDPRQVSSEWILKNIPADSTIGIENIPIYQTLPDIVLKEFYFTQYKTSKKTKYKYVVVNKSTKQFPKYVILTNAEIESKYLVKSDKREIMKIINKLKYKEIIYFSPAFKLLNYFTSDFNYYLSAIVQAPVKIDIYEKL